MDTEQQTFRERITNISRRRVGDIDHNPRNPKRYEKKKSDRLTAVLQQFGKAGVLLTYIDDTGTERFFDGNTRKRLGDDEVWYIAQTDLTQREVDDLVMLYDPLAAPDWEAEILKALAADTAVSGAELEGMIGELLAAAGVAAASPESHDAEPQTNRAEELRQEWGVETGQLWRLPSRTPGQEHRLICGDCTDAAVVERVMGGERAAIAWFDPPFGIDLQPQRQKTQAIQNDGNEAARLLWARFLPLLDKYMSPDTSIFLCQDWSEFDWTLPLVRKHFVIKSKIVWNKNVWGIGYYTRPKHEDILYCWKGKPPTIETPVADVWDVSRESAPEHAAEKPPELSAIAIGHFSKIGQIIIDWFCGLAGSIIAAENLARQCRAVEISPGYVAVALQRYQDAFGIRAELITS